MPFDRQQVKLTASGYFGATAPGSEIWSWGLKLSGTTAFDALAHLADIDMPSLWTEISALHAHPDIATSNSCSFVTLKAAALGIDGIYLTDAVEYQGNGVLGVDGAAVGRMPNQVALVATMRTVTSIGVATRGRFYLPGPAAPPNDEGRLGAGSIAARAVVVADTLSGINAISNANAEPAVIQLMSDVGTSTPRSRAVTTVAIGDVYDTMRSRRNALVEIYNTQPVV